MATEILPPLRCIPDTRPPSELAERPQWVGWLAVVGTGEPVQLPNGKFTKPLKAQPKPHKLPINPRTGSLADTTSKNTWATYESAIVAAQRWPLSGVGFVFSGEDPFAGVDLDNCRNPESGAMAEWASEIIQELNSYTEVSPSGTGVKIWIRGELPRGARNRREYKGGEVEIYSRGRYFTFTGCHVAGAATTVQSRQPELLALHTRLFGTDTGKRKLTPKADAKPVSLDDAALLERAFNAQNGAKFRQLWNGDWQTAGYVSQSEGECALCSLLAFWTGRDPVRIDRLFRRSGLMREKWDRDDYRQRTIDAACACSEVWRPGSEATEAARGPHSAASHNRAQANRGKTKEDWPTPAEIHGHLPPVEAFSGELLPMSFRRLVADIAERMQVPADYPAASTIVCVAGAVNRRASIQPKARDGGWIVVPNLWGGIVAPPGFLKSPVQQAVVRPLQRIQVEWVKQFEEERAQYETTAEECTLRQAAWKEEFKRLTKKGSSPPPKPEGSPPAPRLKRLTVNDCTFEALHEILAHNPAGVLVVRDELTGWWSTLDRQGREGERAFFLQAWNGDTSFTLDRIGRGTIHVEACCVSMLGGIQPARLRSYLVDALQDGPTNDGLIQRFQVLVWPDTSADWQLVDRPPDPTAEQASLEIFEKLINLPADQPLQLRFSPDAQELFYEWLATLEAKIRANDLHPALTSHLSKYRSLMPSLALLFELSAWATGRGDAETVTLEHARLAAAWCDYLESHARRVYSCVVTPQMHAAQELVQKLKAGKLGTSFHCRDVYLKGWTGLDTPEAVKAAAEILEDAGWVRERPAQKQSTGGRPSNAYDVNPAVWR